VAVNVDAINIVSAVYDNKQGKGALKIIATSSLPAATTGLKLTVQATNGTFKLAATAQAMTKVANTATVNNCPVDSNPCWQYSVVGVIKNTISTGFIPPTRIVVNSSRGGSAVLTGSAIVVK
jgi:Flp pilus assembly CpaE family ATPase